MVFHVRTGTPGSYPAEGTNEAGLTVNSIGDGRPTRRRLLGLMLGGATALAAPAVMAGAGEFRRVRLVNERVDERLDLVYWVEGAYVPEALAEISRILRDWRADAVRPYDPRVIDVVAAVQRRLDTSEPFKVVTGYRTPRTNAMLRGRSGGVARNTPS
jgi:Uncharacterized protein conserved in bacteria